MHIFGTQKPDKWEKEIKRFRVNADSAKVRFSCYLLDNIEHPFGTEGNNIGVAKSGCSGLVKGYRREGNTEWLYVEMDTSSRYMRLEFFEAEPTFYYGWIKKSEVVVAGK
jgi:hypothetical protein